MSANTGQQKKNPHGSGSKQSDSSVIVCVELSNIHIAVLGSVFQNQHMYIFSVPCYLYSYLCAHWFHLCNYFVQICDFFCLFQFADS